ncbi:hypothetical protein LMH73_028210 [Vibrio splendidus]|nr:hypothetical protein [Vibrio splendidus]MCC4883215.1 hypothetical protein [Vibrio splendidus]
MTIITEQYIQEQFIIIREACLKLVNEKHWKVIPESVGLNYTRLSEFGKAFPLEKRIELNGRFVGSSAFEKLKDVIAHELAHLCIGCDQHHNAKFKRYYGAFIYNINVDTKKAEIDGEKIVELTPYKWTVIAHLVNGETHNIGGVHRKTKVYSDYHNSDSTHKIKETGIKIARYEFIENKR